MTKRSKPDRDPNVAAFEMVRALTEATGHDDDYTRGSDKGSEEDGVKGADKEGKRKGAATAKK